MTTKEELKQVLRELKRQGESVPVKEKAAEFLKNVDARTLSLAEQELMQEGVSQDDLEILGGTLEQQRPELEASHPIRILMGEHQVILQNLEELGRIASTAETAQEFGNFKDQLEHLREIAHLLLETESHHQREEESLFPRLEKRDVTGPPQIMRLEHEELRAKKRALGKLVEQAGNGNFSEFAQELSEVGGYIADNLRDHIDKEDNILYPTALDILEPEEWSEVLTEFERIGYCYFTPRG